MRLSIGQNVDGVILCPTQISTESIRILKNSRIPFVLIGRRFSPEEVTNYVVCDDTTGALLATRHLLSLGHRNIAYIKTHDHISSDAERFAGYRRALEEADVPFDPALILQLPPTGNSTDMIHRFLTEHPDCSAVLAFSDILAFAVIRELLATGKSVPGDVSVMGFDNICSDYTFPIPLSSVSVSKKNMAQTACEILFELMHSTQSTQAPKEIVLPTQLFLRQTTAAPATSAMPHV